jgi:hypothetical protein
MADAAANLDPVVTLVMSLFLPPAVTDDRIAQTLRTAAEDLFGTSRRPVEGWLAMIPGKWDKENRNRLGGSPGWVDLAWIHAQKRAFLLLPSYKISTEEE